MPRKAASPPSESESEYASESDSLTDSQGVYGSKYFTRKMNGIENDVRAKSEAMSARHIKDVDTIVDKYKHTSSVTHPEELEKRYTTLRAGLAAEDRVIADKVRAITGLGAEMQAILGDVARTAERTNADAVEQNKGFAATVADAVDGERKALDELGGPLVLK